MSHSEQSLLQLDISHMHLHGCKAPKNQRMSRSDTAELCSPVLGKRRIHHSAVEVMSFASELKPPRAAERGLVTVISDVLCFCHIHKVPSRWRLEMIHHFFCPSRAEPGGVR